MPAKFLRSNESTALPSQICIVDTETQRSRLDEQGGEYLHLLRLGVATLFRLEDGEVTRKKTCCFKRSSEFWDFLIPKLQRRRSTWLFAHNLGFDLRTLEFFELVSDGQFTFGSSKPLKGKETKDGKKPWQWRGLLVYEDPPTIVVVKHRQGGTLTCVDTLNWWRCSLAKLGERLGCEKMSIPDWSASDSEWFRYCENDVDILEQSVLEWVRWVRDNDLGMLRWTAASQAMGAYRHRFKNQPIEIHGNDDLRNYEREALYGGRTQQFHDGPVDSFVYQLDVRSMYPSVMRNNLFPTHFLYSKIGVEAEYDVDDIGLDCIATVHLSGVSGGLPYRHDRFGLCYPRGSFWTTLAGPEIVRAKQEGVIKTCSRYTRYHLADIFTDYINWFWARRQELEKAGDLAKANICKQLLVSLYGKWAQRASEWEIINTDMWLDEWEPVAYTNPATHTSVTFRRMGNTIWQKTDRGWSRHAFPAISAWITSYGRERMHQLIQTAGEKNVYYVAVDSLLTNMSGYDRLSKAGEVSPSHIGRLKLEKVAHDCTIFGIGTYALGREVKLMGSSATRQGSVAGHWHERRFEGLKRTLETAPTGGVLEQWTPRQLNRGIIKGTVHSNGRVSPPRLSR
ncbi:MAG: DNA polymerase [Acidobacteriota bacterium]